MPSRRRPTERLAARAITGAPGHLWSVLADLAVFGAQRMLAGVGKRSSSRR